MTTIEVVDAGTVRPARSGSGAAVVAFLKLLGRDIPCDDVAVRPLGDALFTIGEALGLRPFRSLLVAATLSEGGAGTLAAGDISRSPDDVALAGFLEADAERDVVVADDRVPAKSAAELLRCSSETTAPGRVIGVLSLSEACDRLFGLHGMAEAGVLVPPEFVEKSREALFRAALAPERSVMEWRLVAAVAGGILHTVEHLDDASAYELRLVRAIAWRHDGKDAFIEWPEDDCLERYDQSTRLELLAHLVQSAADGDLGRVPEYLERAMAAVRDLEGQAVLKLRGAIGRALASVGRFEEAVDVLDDALAHWMRIDRSQVSFALCELLRVLGVLGKRERVLALKELVQTQLVDALSVDSRRYVDLALGRALTQVGEAALALDLLEAEAPSGHARDHVYDAAYRWRAAAARAVGDERRTRESLERLEGRQTSEQRWLARLDAESSSVDEVLACLRALVDGADDGEAKRTFDRIGGGLSLRAFAERPDLVRRFRAESRY